MWLQTLLKELKITHPPAARLWCDNIGATYLSTVFHALMKHIKVDFYFVREQVSLKLLDILQISTKDQLADGLTKPLWEESTDSFSSQSQRDRYVVIEGEY
jgi:hypothetical protein